MCLCEQLLYYSTSTCFDGVSSAVKSECVVLVYNNDNYSDKGLGFGFLRSPYIVSGSLNGYLLETDPAVPCHAPAFDAELVWEADKRRLRNLRVQNVPVKIEVHAMGTQGRKNKVGYLLLSLLGAQPTPSFKMSNVKYTWHRLLGVRAEGKCCHPQLMLGLTIEDRSNTITPRNELKIFHSNEASSYLPTSGNVTIRPKSLILEDYLAESKKTATSPELLPRLLVEEGLIQIGPAGSHLFVLSFVLGAAENVDTLLPQNGGESADCLVTYSVFTHSIQTDRVPAIVGGVKKNMLQFNQRSSLRMCTDLSSLSRYFSECPQVVTRLCCGEQDIGICSTDLRKLVPTEDVETFVSSFCNAERAITVGERCFIVPYVGTVDATRRPFIDIEISLKYVGPRQEKNVPRVGGLATRSASHLGCADSRGVQEPEVVGEATLELHKSRSCTEVDRDVASVTYTNITALNTSRYKNATGDTAIEGHNEVADMIKKMYESFSNSQEKLLKCMVRPATSDIQVQCSDSPRHETARGENDNGDGLSRSESPRPEELHRRACSDTNNIQIKEQERLNTLVSTEDRESLMKKCVDELEDWKEQQQKLFNIQLKQKEEYHLEMLSEEWNKRRSELEGKLSRGIEQCRNLAADLSRATEDFRLRGYRNTQREQKLLQAKQSLEQHYTGKFQELREASQKMEDDMRHQARLKDVRIEDLEATVGRLQKENETLKNTITDMEKDTQKKQSGLTKGQTASIIQELKALEEKLEDAVQSKAFFKEQWGRAVRELHAFKLQDRRRMVTRLQQKRRHSGDTRLDKVADNGDANTNQDNVEFQKLTDDFYVNLLAETPVIAEGLCTNSSSPFVDCLERTNERLDLSKKASDEKLCHLIEERDRLIEKDYPDEDQVSRLNNEIRNIFLSCGT